MQLVPWEQLDFLCLCTNTSAHLHDHSVSPDARSWVHGEREGKVVVLPLGAAPDMAPLQVGQKGTLHPGFSHRICVGTEKMKLLSLLLKENACAQAKMSIKFLVMHQGLVDIVALILLMKSTRAATAETQQQPHHGPHQANCLQVHWRQGTI